MKSAARKRTEAARDEWLDALEAVDREHAPVGETLESLRARWGVCTNAARNRLQRLVAAGKAECVGRRKEKKHGLAKVYRLVK